MRITGGLLISKNTRQHLGFHYNLFRIGADDACPGVFIKKIYFNLAENKSNGRFLNDF